MSVKNHEFKETSIHAREVITIFIIVVTSVVAKKDTGDVVEEILVLETALLTDLIHCLEKQHLALWPVVLQQHHHMPKGQVVTAVCEGTELIV